VVFEVVPKHQQEFTLMDTEGVFQNYQVHFANLRHSGEPNHAALCSFFPWLPCHSQYRSDYQAMSYNQRTYSMFLKTTTVNFMASSLMLWPHSHITGQDSLEIAK